MPRHATRLTPAILVRRVAGRASLLPGPLRTVRAPHDAHGSSKPLPQPTSCRLMSGGRNDLRFTAVDLLVAIQVRQFKVRQTAVEKLEFLSDVPGLIPFTMLLDEAPSLTHRASVPTRSASEGFWGARFNLAAGRRVNALRLDGDVAVHPCTCCQLSSI